MRNVRGARTWSCLGLAGAAMVGAALVGDVVKVRSAPPRAPPPVGPGARVHVLVVAKGDRLVVDRRRRIVVPKVAPPSSASDLGWRLVGQNRGSDRFEGHVRVLMLDSDGRRLVFSRGNLYEPIEIAPGEEVTLDGRASGSESTDIALDLRSP